MDWHPERNIHPFTDHRRYLGGQVKIQTVQIALFTRQCSETCYLPVINIAEASQIDILSSIKTNCILLYNILL